MGHYHKLIAVDLDDVLFDFIGHFFAWHNDVYDTNLQPEDMAFATLWEAWGGTKEEATERVPLFFEEIDMLRMEPMEGAVSSLRVLRNIFRLVIISARHPDAIDATNEWIDLYFPEVFDKVAVGVGNPLAQDLPMSKAELCTHMGVDLLIEDQLKNAADVARSGVPVLLFGDRPWNQSDELPANVERVRDWDHIITVLLEAS